ncbi:stealth family protein [Pseudocitrobacter sp. 73]|uniref:stealth family protein n=1 Tax=Pseudocitrobacter sp. 73 TaxID=2605731 RepID=UPI0011EDCAEE|nr:stealth family protein [Pseudocitrobacter sp. 73]KAA1049551.1 UDP-N-acetylglucosamine-lysosomal-acetylglucosaminephosphotransferase [Pseudocitrobacter sp. 73]
MSRLIKKTKKLFRSPKLFFKDSVFFSGKTSGTSISNTSAVVKHGVKSTSIVATNKNTVKFSSLIEDFVTPHGQDEVLFHLLDKAGINYLIVPTAWEHILRIAIQDSFVNTIVDLIKGYDGFTKKVYVAKDKNRYSLIKLYFHDDEFVFKNKIIQLDPWYITPSGIMTRNKNNLIQFIPKAHINKTVHSFAPIRLGRDIHDIDNLKSISGLESFMFDEYQEPIDIVFTWVSDSDPKWLEKKSFYSGEKAGNLNTRFADYEQLRYSLRSVEAYARFIRYIYIVTDNQVPYWLNAEHAKIKIINHSDICDDNSCLPVFNSVAIESWIHKIEGLSENFIYANDDYFFGSPVTKSHFIHPNGIGKLFLEPLPNAYGEIFEDSEPTTQLSLFTMQCFYNRYHRWPSYWPLHAPMIKNVHDIKDMVEEFKPLMEKTSRSRFREMGTISPLYLMSAYYAYESGRSVLSSIKYEYISTDADNLDARLDGLLSRIKESKCDVFCLNDHRSVSEEQIQKVVMFMKKAFPIAASWELDIDIQI